MATKKLDLVDLVGGDESAEDALGRVCKKFGLTQKQAKFVHEYTRNGKTDKMRAALLAGYSSKNYDLLMSGDKKNPLYKKALVSLQIMVYAQLRNPKIIRALAEYEDAFKEEKRKDIEDDLYRLAQLRAFFDLRKVVDTVVGYSPEEIADKIKKLPLEAAMCIDSIEFKYWGKDADRFTANIKFADRQKNLEFLSKLTNMIGNVKDADSKKSETKMPTINIAIVGSDDNGSIAIEGSEG
jgi:flagellar motility protein MotE (MotC chaperone)